MAKEKFILLSLKEEESKQLAQVMANDTARKILDSLADKDATETELSKTLGVPLSTVHYNLQALVKGKLVEAEEYHYSKKGKEILHYKLANKYIIIAPKSTFGIKEKLRSILPAVLVIGVGTWLIQKFGTQTLQTPTAEIAPAMMAKSAPVLADEAGNVMMRFGAEAVPEVAKASFQMNPALWFLLGSVLAVVVLVLADYVQYKRKQ